MTKNDVKHTFTEKEAQEWLQSMLRTEKMTVEFVKKDGSQRKMLCTLIENMIPSEKKPKGSEKSRSDDTISVFDLEKNDWRSFRYDSITAVSFSLGAK